MTTHELLRHFNGGVVEQDEMFGLKQIEWTKLPRSAGLQNELKRKAFDTEDLLGWVDDYADISYVSLKDIFDENRFLSLIAAISDRELRKALRQAAQNRISPLILSPAGLLAVRWLAACMQAAPLDALEALLGRISYQAGCKPRTRLTSLASVGKSLVG